MSKYNPKKHNRKSIRLKGYDYSQAGLYFITFCAQDRVNLFGEITEGKMNLNEPGQMLESEWLKLTDRFPKIKLHEFVVMPNHFHAILEIVAGATLVVAPRQPKAPVTLGEILAAYKSITTVEYIKGVKTKNWPQFNKKVWQRNYWEYIIRDKNAYKNISQYIINNPMKWSKDKLNGGDGNIVMEPFAQYGEEVWMV